MAKVRISARLAEQAGPGEYWDTDIIGFKLVVTPKGWRTFAIEGRLHGRKVKCAFGRVGTITVEQARKRAKELLFAIVEGRNPALEAEAARTAWLVSDLVAEFRQSHLPKLRESSRKQYDSYLKRFILPTIGSRKAAEVSVSDMLALFRHAQSSCRGRGEAGLTTANRVLATASSLFREAGLLGIRSDNPCRAVKRNPESRRERYLSRDETARLLAACDASRHKVVANLIRLLLFTGARRGEALSAQWREFDLTSGVWVKPSHHTKQKRLHCVPLSPAAVALLNGMAEASTGRLPSDWVFPGAKSGTHLVSPKRAAVAIFRAAGLGSDVCLHTLRHSFAARIVSSGHGLHAAGKLLGHTQASTTHRYAHLEHDAQRRALLDADSAIAMARSELSAAA